MTCQWSSCTTARRRRLPTWRLISSLKCWRSRTSSHWRLVSPSTASSLASRSGCHSSAACLSASRRGGALACADGPNSRQRNFVMAKSNAVIGERSRRIAHRTYGRRHGPITRLMSPSDLGEILKPFVFLDLFNTEGGSLSGFGLHPHSGIATLTCLLEGSIRYEDTTGATGILPERGVEWFNAAHGAWHGGGAGESARSRGFQLWIALPSEQELGKAESIYQAPQDIRQIGPASVLLGQLDTV